MFPKMIILNLCFVVFLCLLQRGSSYVVECIYDDRGLCMEPCPAGTKSYNPSCEEVAFSQKTCRSPKQRSLGIFCDFSRCDCPSPLVWDEVKRICVAVKDCSDQSQLKNDDTKF